MHLTYVALHEVTWCMAVWCTQNMQTAAVSCGTSHASAVSTPLRWIFKNMLQKASHSCRIICEHSQFAREWRIALYKQPAISQSIHSQKESHRQVKPTWNIYSLQFASPEQSASMYGELEQDILWCICQMGSTSPWTSYGKRNGNTAPWTS